MSKIDDLSFKRTGVAQFDGTPSKLKAFITDISMFLTYKKINHTTDDGKKQAASIVYIHLTEDVRKIVRQMSVEVLNDYTALIQELKSTFGIREADELTTFMREFNSIRQNANEYLRDYLVRCEILAHKIKAIDPAIDLITMAGGKLLTYQVREGIRNPAVRSILTLDGEATWAQFKLKGMNLSQTDTIETSAEHKSANIGAQLPYKPPGDKKPAANNAKYYCSLHGKNATHDTNQCRTLAYNNSKNKKSSGNNGGIRVAAQVKRSILARATKTLIITVNTVRKAKGQHSQRARKGHQTQTLMRNLTQIQILTTRRTNSMVKP